MTRAVLAALFEGLFDDAALFPPASLPMPNAVRGHAGHRLSWYADMVGPFVCNARRLRELDDQAAGCSVALIEVAVVVPDGIEAVPKALDTIGSCERLRLAALEVSIGYHRLPEVLRALAPLTATRVPVFVEIPAPRVTEDAVHDLNAQGLRLKLRTGGTTVDAFCPEAALAVAIVRCAAERLAFKCTAGLHHAVRHRDPATLLEHHGFLNIALAARVAASTGSAATTAAVRSERHSQEILRRVVEFSSADVTATRALFGSFGTCSVADPVGDLTAMGLVTGP
ncbi:MAG: hypothetical protein ABR604_07935 [Jatrophihabitantaceae bacterium]